MGRTNMRDVFTRDERKRWNVSKVKNNTWVYHPGPGVKVYRLHKTDIIRIDENRGIIVLNNGGWNTITTKERLNEFAPVIRVNQHNYEWYVQYPLGDDLYVTLDFENGMEIPNDVNVMRKRAKRGDFGSEIQLKMLYSK